MTELRPIFNEMPVLMILAVAGFFLYKIKIIDSGSLKGFSGLLMYVSLPASILNSFLDDIDTSLFTTFFESFIVAIIIYLLLVISATLFFIKRQDDETIVFKLSIVFSNCGFMGIPIISGLFGNEGVIYTSIFVLVYNVLLWTYGISILQKKNRSYKGFLKVLFNPGILSIIIGIVIIFFDVRIPYIIEKPISLLGSLTTPLAMIIVGAMFVGKSFKGIFLSLKINMITSVRLIIIPIVFIIIFKVFGFSLMYAKVFVLLLAMPVATTTAIICEQFNKAPGLASEVVGYSTLLSAITLPCIYYFMNLVL